MWCQDSRFNPLDVFQKEAMEATTEHPEPVYTAMAKQLKLQGVVAVSAFVDKDGTVSEVIVQLGNPVLAEMVTKAVKQWRFRPFRDEKGAVGFAKVYLQFDLRVPK